MWGLWPIYSPLQLVWTDHGSSTPLDICRVPATTTVLGAGPLHCHDVVQYANRTTTWSTMHCDVSRQSHRNHFGDSSGCSNNSLLVVPSNSLLVVPQHNCQWLCWCFCQSLFWVLCWVHTVDYSMKCYIEYLTEYSSIILINTCCAIFQHEWLRCMNNCGVLLKGSPPGLHIQSITWIAWKRL